MNKFVQFREYIQKYQLGSTLENVSFKCLTTLKVGGTCRILYFPDDLESLVLSVKFLKRENIPYFMIGAGSNLLVNDRDFDLVVISLKKFKRYYIDKEDNQYWDIYVEAGVRAPILANYLADRKISGAEFLCVIPGTMGGLTCMNAGAYKRCMADIIHSVTFLDEQGDIQTLTNKDNQLQFTYRKSMFQNKELVIISILLRFPKGCQGELPKDKMHRYLKTKRESQPIDTSNAGSVFKNQGDFFSWQIIDQLGYRGYKIGGAKVSEKHANFIINDQDATFLDMITLIQMITYDAKKKLNVSMECEWEILQ